MQWRSAPLVVGGAAVLLGVGGSRWTASIAEGYFSYVIRVGTRLLFFYLVLGIGVQIATQWQAALTAACNPVATSLPWYSTYGAPPKAMMTTICSNAIPVRTMLDLTALSIIFLMVTLAVPYTAASIVSGALSALRSAALLRPHMSPRPWFGRSRTRFRRDSVRFGRLARLRTRATGKPPAGSAQWSPADKLSGSAI